MNRDGAGLVDDLEHVRPRQQRKESGELVVAARGGHDERHARVGVIDHVRGEAVGDEGGRLVAIAKIGLSVGAGRQGNPRQLNASIAAAQRLLASRKLPQLRAECWRLAYYYRRSGHETCRSIVRSVLEGCRSGGWLEDVPAEWIGTTCIEPVVTELFEAVTVMDLEHAEAVGAILRLYRSVPLEKNEVLRLPWFEPSYLSAFVGKVQALTHVPSLSL